jgi:uncharacterized protein (TIRG00374 family)
MKLGSINGRNLFFILGFLALAGMAYTIGFDIILNNIVKTGWWFVAIIGMWLPIYMINTAALNTIIRDENPDNRTLPFWHLLKINISGFGLKAATPLGFLGGDPYKILELKRFFGMEKATSSVLLYTMSHITAHCLFWSLSIVAAALWLPMPESWSITLMVTFIVFLFLLFLLWRGYRKGMTVSLFDGLSRVPFLKKWALPFVIKHSEGLANIDKQISYLYNSRTKAFIKTIALELIARIANCLEVYVILRSANENVTLIQSITIYSFMSLFTNIFFFSPMQIGTREGGFFMAFTALALKGTLGIYVSLITRLRELIWIGIGVLLMKVKSGFVPAALVDRLDQKVT